MTKPTLFIVTDIETTMRDRRAFDVAWRTIDRKGREYDAGSYALTDVLALDFPFYKQKLGFYFEDVYAHRIKPATIRQVRDHYNDMIATLLDAGHRVIGCAYNAAFDFRYLPETYTYVTGSNKFLGRKIGLLDIWNYWGSSVPKNYTADYTASGCFLSTSAESAYRFEYGDPTFEERHIAWHDVLIESDILLKALSRKKPLSVVDNPRAFEGNIWRKINERLGVDVETILAKRREAKKLEKLMK